ncbi:MAG: bifunctional 2-C-methyl-D-erythritol 4-phosphate cytidylyltransferase/2-C-methyl-D-erythritol 2,4-cyclodiphosphate synthase [Epsilonproteobacteria bacterium]|nr:MAG: bifunctional 2-C-methyl-D-erythritol 4-phosphate cytidylyltransferase/2-C-methyl-D-erythritol 2,4-cyclodiphosphate synthase [Campylobacterota bacterium]
MSNTTLILLGAGSSSRFENTVKKQWLYTGEIPLWLFVAKHFENVSEFENIIIVSSQEEIDQMQQFASYHYVVGGDSRQASLKNALSEVKSTHVLVSDIARACVPAEMIHRILSAKAKASCIVPVLPINDTIYLDNKPIDRDKVRIIQTPQLSVTKWLKKALDADTIYTDDSSAIASLGETIHFVQGSTQTHKLTCISDLQKLTCLEAPSAKTLTGFGIDTHSFEAGKKMFLCGVQINVDYGFKAHSDGDVAIHALIDALLGAAGMGDIGELYPDNNVKYKNIDSKILLQNTVKKILSFGYSIGNIDMTIMAETPKLLPYKETMRTNLASLLGLNKHLLNIKASTSEKLGFIGREEGVSVHAIANLTYLNWKKL